MLPGGEHSRIAAIDSYEGELDEAVAPMSVALRLEDELDVSRGELICHPERAPLVARELAADVCWMADRPLRAGGRYLFKQTTRTATAIVEQIEDLLDVHTLERDAPPAELTLNDIGRVRLRTSLAARVRPLQEQPPHGQLHPDRRGQQRHRRRGDDRRCGLTRADLRAGKRRRPPPAAAA